MEKKTCTVCNGKGFVNCGGMTGIATCGHCLGYGYIDKDIKKKSDKVKKEQTGFLWNEAIRKLYSDK